MKKLFYLLLFVGLAVICCNKPDYTPTEIEVSFEASMGGSNFKASTCTDCPVPSFDCNTSEAETAKLVIDGVTYTVDIIHDSDVVYPQSIKLPVQSTDYTLTSFELYNHDGDTQYNDFPCALLGACRT